MYFTSCYANNIVKSLSMNCSVWQIDPSVWILYSYAGCHKHSRISCCQKHFVDTGTIFCIHWRRTLNLGQVVTIRPWCEFLSGSGIPWLYLFFPQEILLKIFTFASHCNHKYKIILWKKWRNVNILKWIKIISFLYRN